MKNRRSRGQDVSKTAQDTAAPRRRPNLLSRSPMMAVTCDDFGACPTEAQDSPKTPQMRSMSASREVKTIDVARGGFTLPFPHAHPAPPPSLLNIILIYSNAITIRISITVLVFIIVHIKIVIGINIIILTIIIIITIISTIEPGDTMHHKLGYPRSLAQRPPIYLGWHGGGTCRRQLDTVPHNVRPTGAHPP
eukprot:9486136-Pyramimonas_sp.AAC.3